MAWSRCALAISAARGWLALVAIALTALAATMPQAARASPERSCDIPSPSGTRTIPLSDQDQERPFLLHVPQGYDGHHRLPLVLNLHARVSNGAEQMAISQADAAADRRGFAVAAPTGAVRLAPGVYQWHVPGGLPVPPGTPDDEQYLLRVIEAAEEALCIDSKRIYFMGFAGGSLMTSRMACDHAEEIAANAVVAGLRAGIPEPTPSGGWQPDPETCRPGDVVPVLAFHGTADNFVPYAGNNSPIWGYSVETALASWAEINRCQAGPRTQVGTVSVDLISYRGCHAHGSGSLYRANGAGHTSPGSPFPFPVAVFGLTDQTISATELILDFFAKHQQQKHVR